MKYTLFTYTKESGEVSQREVVVTQQPSTLLYGLDVSELTQQELGDFAAGWNALQDRQAHERATLLRRFELDTRRRSFNPVRMSNIVKSWV